MNEDTRHKLAKTLTLLIDECDLELVKGVRHGTMTMAAAKKFAANTEKLREFRDELEQEDAKERELMRIVQSAANRDATRDKEKS